MADPSTVTPTEDTKQETSRPSSPSTLSIPQIQIISRDNNSTDQAGDTTIIQEISEKVALPPASTSRTRSQSAPNQTNTTEYRVNSKLSRLEMMKRTARYCHDHEYDNIDEIEGQLSLLKDVWNKFNNEHCDVAFSTRHAQYLKLIIILGSKKSSSAATSTATQGMPLPFK
ncbi:hypothetical protein PV325_013181 [Microctonus aethiopoides]|nr:hypothetical protein PV325_013181 [Microctonus aethiopoides]KAK0071446.1 hypothetical protein PV326_001230 [Microctonus aethiopoides]